MNGARLMSENVVMQDTTTNQVNPIENGSISAGQMLKQARLDAGLHIAALAVSLRVPVKRIEALESGQMDLLPDMVFVRALTSSICQTLKIDAAPILNKLPRASLPRLNGEDVAINTPISASGDGKGALLSNIVTSPWLMGVLLLCLGATGIYLWPKATSLAISDSVASAKILPESGISQAKELQVSTENAVISSPNANVTTTSVALPNAIVPSSDSLVSATTVAAAVSPVIEASNSNVPAKQTLPPADSIVVFKASGETWVEVKNAAGSTVFKKLVKAGETAGASGALPLTVIVGRANVTQVEVRGKSIDLALIAKSNVARFEVK
jgi:cytoskeleton protein RodZ